MPADEEPSLRNVNDSVDEDVDPGEGPPEPSDAHLLLQNNDPRLDELHIGVSPGEFIPHDDDWARAGECIARSARLKRLFLDWLDGGVGDREVEESHFMALCRGMAGNKSINTLGMCSHPFGGREFTALIPFFQKNINLRRLIIDNDAELDAENTRLLASALNSFCTLEYFQYSGFDAGEDPNGYDEPTENTITAMMKSLSRHTKLKELHLYGGNDVFSGKRAYQSLASIIQNQKSSLTTLVLHGDEIDDLGAITLGVALASNKRLLHLELNVLNNVRSGGWIALSMSLGHSRLEKVSLLGNFIDEDALKSIAVNLSINNSIKHLNLSHNKYYPIHQSGWQALFDCLEQSKCSIEHLNLSNNNLTNEWMASFAPSLAKNRSIQSLDISANDMITLQGMKDLSIVLEKDPVLKHLSLTWMSDEEGECLAKSLSTNECIVTLNIGGWSLDERCMTRRGHESFAKALCDDESIMATFNSNHNIERISFGYREQLAEDLKSSFKLYFNINSSLWPIYAARAKILKVHFNGSKADLEPFLAMPLEVLPRAIEWIGMEGDSLSEMIGQNVMYELIKRVFPSLIWSNGKSPRNKRKRKGNTIIDYFKKLAK